MSAPTPIRWALEQLGEHEQGGPNCGPVVARAIGPWTQAPPGPGMLWCAAFVSTALLAGGAERALELGTLSAERLRDHMADYLIDADPQPGDVVWFPRAGNRWHVGLVAEVAGGGPLLQIVTVEGNANDAVSSRTYAWREVRRLGHARPRLVGSCGALPPMSADALTRCRQPAGHAGLCDTPRLADLTSQPVLLGPSGARSRQGRALQVLRTQRRLDIQGAARRFCLSPAEWHGLETGAFTLPDEEFARVCRGLC